MRNIKFDESTVLKEFARLAHEQGLVKVAQDYQPPVGRGPTADPRQLQQMQPPLPAPGPSIETGAPAPAAVPASPAKPVISTTGAVKQIGDMYSKFLEQYNYDTAAAQKAIMPYITQHVKKLLSSGAKPADVNRFKQVALQYIGAKPAQRAEDMLESDANTENTTVKQAKSDKFYDVSGETGEDLVEKAHPGGGTKTELTHSKTDENLVETIVEQQERDIEVARKEPKGTYAALVNLYTQLSKMGHASRLNGLKKAIRTISTPEEVMEHVLVILADDLDRHGYFQYADKVDQVLKVAKSDLKKKVAQEAPEITQGNRVLDFLARNVANLASSLTPDQRQQATNLSSYISGLKGEYNPDRIANELLPYLSGLAKQNYSGELQRMLVGALANTKQQVSQYVTPEVSTSQKLGLLPLGQGGTRAVQKWQINFNRRYGLKPNNPKYLRPDGIWGPNTQVAYLMEKRKQRQQTEEAKPTETPAPPASPSSLRTYESLYNRAAEMFNQQVAPLRNYPAAEEVLRQKAKDWETMLAKNPGFTDRAMLGVMRGWVNQIGQNLGAIEKGGPGVSQQRPIG